MTKNKIPYTKPSITSLEINYANDAVVNGWGSSCYEYIKRFEKEFCKYLDVKYSIATSSCTGALHMGMAALNIGPGDEVIVANTNWIASVSPIIYLGATPIFIDIDPQTWCLNPDHIEKAINKKTKAIIAVHLYGNLCDMDKIIEISKKYKLPIIEDSAEAIGSVYKNRKAGSIGTFGAFSFHGTKTICTGEGGMFVTNDSDLFEKVKTLSNHGRSHHQKKQFWAEFVGYKYKMSNVQAAIGLGQLERIDELVDEKRRIFNTYKNILSELPLDMNIENKIMRNGFWMPNIVINKGINFRLDNLIKSLNDIGADARQFFWPLSKMNIGGVKAFDFDYISEEIHLRALNLPSPFGISDEDIESICSCIIESLE